MDFFAHYNEIPKYVVSTTLQEDDLVDNWGDTTIVRSLDDVAKVKATVDGEISIHGSATLARELADAGLIDRYHLLLHPLLLGLLDFVRRCSVISRLPGDIPPKDRRRGPFLTLMRVALTTSSARSSWTVA
jgi:dihydrofolate reductase